MKTLKIIRIILMLALPVSSATWEDAIGLNNTTSFFQRALTKEIWN